MYVQDYCPSCSVCHLTGDKRILKFPLQSLSIIDVPFSKIAMDIVGPLEQTQSGHHYILCVITVLDILRLSLYVTLLLNK